MFLLTYGITNNGNILDIILCECNNIKENTRNQCFPFNVVDSNANPALCNMSSQTSIGGTNFPPYNKSSS